MINELSSKSPWVDLTIKELETLWTQVTDGAQDCAVSSDPSKPAENDLLNTLASLVSVSFNTPMLSLINILFCALYH